MIISKDGNTGKQYVLTTEQENALNYMRSSFDTIVNSFGVNEAITQAYLINLASNSFMEAIKESNDGKSIPELLGLEEYRNE